MERDEAAKSGLDTISFDRFPNKVLYEEAGDDSIKAMAIRYKKMFAECGISKGKVALYGNTEVGEKFAVLTQLQKLLPDLELIGFIQDPIIMTAMMTKDDQELARIRKMGIITTSVVSKVAKFLSSQKSKDEILIDEYGTPITVGHLNQKLISGWQKKVLKILKIPFLPSARMLVSLIARVMIRTSYH